MEDSHNAPGSNKLMLKAIGIVLLLYLAAALAGLPQKGTALIVEMHQAQQQAEADHPTADVSHEDTHGEKPSGEDASGHVEITGHTGLSVDVDGGNLLVKRTAAAPSAE